MLGFLQWLLRRDALLRALKPAFGRFHPFLPEHRRDPQTTWRALRETAPLYRSRMFGTYLCTRYDDVLHVLRDPSFSTDRSQVPAMRVINRLTRREPDFAGLIERNLLTMDGDEHRRLRGLVSKAFTPRRVEQLRRFDVGREGRGTTSVWAPSSRSSRRRWRSAPSCDASRISPERPSLRPGGAR